MVDVVSVSYSYPPVSLIPWSMVGIASGDTLHLSTVLALTSRRYQTPILGRLSGGIRINLPGMKNIFYGCLRYV